MGWIAGHIHKDYFGYVHGHTNQPFVVLTASGKSSSQDRLISGTNSRDCFNIITFSYLSESEQLIKIMRIGSDKDMYNRSKNSLCFNIVDKTVIYQD